MIYSNSICDYCSRVAIDKACQGCDSYNAFPGFVGKKVEEIIVTIKESKMENADRPLTGHAKYCRLSKFENKLCNRVIETESCQHGAYTQCFKDWETCPLPAKQQEIVEKDLMDRVIDRVLNIQDEGFYYMGRKTMRGLLAQYTEALEAEKQPCEYCECQKGVIHLINFYCNKCGRRLN